MHYDNYRIDCRVAYVLDGAHVMKLTTAAPVAICLGGALIVLGNASAAGLIGSFLGLIIGTLGCASVAESRGRSEWVALWGFCGLLGWIGVTIFLKRRP